MNFPYTVLTITALCALVSAILTRLIMLGFRRNHLGFTLIWMLLFPVSLVIGFLYVKPFVEARRARVEAFTLIEGEPLLSLLSSRHSDVESEMQKVMTRIVQQGFSGQDARRAAFRQSLGFLMPYFETYVPVAEDTALWRYGGDVVRVLNAMAGRPGAPCYWFITGAPAPDGSTFAGVPEDEIDELSLAMSQVVRSALSNPQPPMSPDERSAYAREIHSRIEVRAGEAFLEDLKLLEEPVRSDEQRERICRVTHALLAEARDLPHEHRGRALRVVLMGL